MVIKLLQQSTFRRYAAIVLSTFFLLLLFSMCNCAVNWCDKLCFLHLYCITALLSCILCLLNDYHFKPDEVRVQVQIWDLECNQISAVSALNRQILARLSYKKTTCVYDTGYD